MMAETRTAGDQSAVTGHRSQPADGNWVAVCRRQDIVPNTGVCALVGGRQVAVFRLDDDSVYALSNHDPFSRAKIFVSRHAVGPEIVPFAEAGHEHEEEHGSGFDLEEGYVEWVGLPGSLALKVGKFQQRFGTLNRWHSHALPFQSRSLPHLAYLGEEALTQSGGSLSWLAPFGGGRAGTYEASVEVMRSGHDLFGVSTRASVLGHVNGFWQFGASTDLELNLSWVNGSYEDSTQFLDRDVYGVEFAFNWIPPALTRQRGLTVRGGAMVLEGLLPHEDDPGGVADADAFSDSDFVTGT